MKASSVIAFHDYWDAQTHDENTPYTWELLCHICMVVVLPFTVPNSHGHYQHKVGYNTDNWQALIKR
jgi:hypothetical protein